LTRLWEGAFTRHCLKKGIAGMMICFILSGGLLLLTLFFYPNVAQSGLKEAMQEMMQAFPAEMLQRFGLNNIPDFSDYHHYLAAAMQIQLLIGCMFASYLGASSLIRFESDHSMIFLYSHPISRFSIVYNKLICQLCLMTLYNIGIFLIVYLMSAAFVAETGLFLLLVLRVFFAFWLVHLLYLCAGFFFSSCLSHSSQCSSIAFLLFLFSLLFGLLSGLVPGFGFLRFLSPYFYFQVYPLLMGDPMALSYILVCLLVSLGSVAACAFRYQRKDFYL
jgi:ABC-2 type transport system permease protein